MNPQFEQSQGLRLPQPSLESSSVQPGAEGQPSHEQQGTGREAAPAAPPIPAPTQPSAPSPVLPPDPLPALPVAPLADDADDSSLDEEWISKAKQIVELTRTDPYKQSNELSKFKADYLKVRHNKIIKIVEDSPK